MVQRSAAYNFVRYKIYLYRHGHVTGSDTPAAREHKEAFYNELLTAFAEDLAPFQNAIGSGVHRDDGGAEAHRRR